jgi:hypothetical protein
MPGIYGELLDHFPEQFQSIPVFDMDPKINNGYENKTPDVLVQGIIQNYETDVLDNNGNLAVKAGLYLWTYRPVTAGFFCRYQNTVYRLIVANDWPREGGFFEYRMERLVGSDGQVQVTPAFNNTGSWS